MTADELAAMSNLPRRLADQLQNSCYVPKPWLRLRIQAGKKDRPLDLPSIIDRVLMTRFLAVYRTLLEEHLNDVAWGALPGRGPHGGAQRLQHALSPVVGRRWILLHTDLADCYPSVPHARLDRALAKIGLDQRSRALVSDWLTNPAVFGQQLLLPEDRGLPQGLPISADLLHGHLLDFDRRLDAKLCFALRYIDDIVVACPHQRAAEDALDLIGRLARRAGMEINDEKTRFHAVDEPGFLFLGQMWNGRSFDPYEPNPDRRSVRIRGAGGSRLVGSILAGMIEQGLLDRSQLGAAPDTLLNFLSTEAEIAGPTAKWYGDCHLKRPLRTLYIDTPGCRAAHKRGAIVVS